MYVLITFVLMWNLLKISNVFINLIVRKVQYVQPSGWSIITQIKFVSSLLNDWYFNNNSSSYKGKVRKVWVSNRCMFFMALLWDCFGKPPCRLLNHSSSITLTDTTTEVKETMRSRCDERGTQRLDAMPAGCRSAWRCCHYCCKGSGGHAVITWKSIPEQPAGLSCSSAVGQYGLSVTTNQFGVDECALTSDIHNQKIESDTQSCKVMDCTKSIKKLLIYKSLWKQIITLLQRISSIS